MRHKLAGWRSNGHTRFSAAVVKEAKFKPRMSDEDAFAGEGTSQRDTTAQVLNVSYFADQSDVNTPAGAERKVREEEAEDEAVKGASVVELSPFAAGGQENNNSTEEGMLMRTSAVLANCTSFCNSAGSGADAPQPDVGKPGINQ
jgi:hypothetical protein